VEYVMTQVFAAINHRLSEEYQKIELPSQEAKDRLLADAKYLHERLSALKNVGVPSNMLETIVLEKSVARRADASPASGILAGTTANQRIKNMLASRDVKSPEKEKPLPSPSPTPALGPTKSVADEVPPPPEKAGFREIPDAPSPNGAFSPTPPTEQQSPEQ